MSEWTLLFLLLPILAVGGPCIAGELAAVGDVPPRHVDTDVGARLLHRIAAGQIHLVDINRAGAVDIELLVGLRLIEQGRRQIPAESPEHLDHPGVDFDIAWVIGMFTVTVDVLAAEPVDAEEGRSLSRGLHGHDQGGTLQGQGPDLVSQRGQSGGAEERGDGQPSAENLEGKAACQIGDVVPAQRPFRRLEAAAAGAGGRKWRPHRSISCVRSTTICTCFGCIARRPIRPAHARALTSRCAASLPLR